jgi:hypothetical protein
MKHSINRADSGYPFQAHQPVRWVPSREEPMEDILSITRDHGVKGSYVLHNPRDQINANRRYLDRIVLEYKIGRNRYPLFTIGDFFEVPYTFEDKAMGNIMGDLAERISRRITKYFLKHFSKEGDTGGIFDKRFDPAHRNNFIVTHTDTYVLKIERYPNLVILKRTGKGKYGYENIKELDGLFDYRYQKKRHILVLESKLDKINVNDRELVTNLFKPLSELIGDATFSYILFSDRESILTKKDLERRRQLRPLPRKIFETLRGEGIGVLYFTFNESRNDFERMARHLITQYRAIAHLGLVLHGKMVLSDKEIVLFDGGQTPHLKLIKDRQTGMWREVAIRHKRPKSKKSQSR